MNTQPTKIDFVQYHQPGLESGEYKLTINQTLSVDGATKTTPALTRMFHVAGERFHLQPEHVHSVFPPAHSQSDCANVFPHVLLSRNTLPWEREAIPGDVETPWLALLVVHENEMDQVEESVVAIDEIAKGVVSAPDVEKLEPGQTTATKVAVVDIKKGLLDKIMPSGEALNYLTHVRQELYTGDSNTRQEIDYVSNITSDLPPRITFWPNEKGISNVRLHYKIAGGSETSQAMTLQSDGEYAYTIREEGIEKGKTALEFWFVYDKAGNTNSIVSAHQNVVAGKVDYVYKMTLDAQPLISYTHPDFIPSDAAPAVAKLHYQIDGEEPQEVDMELQKNKDGNYNGNLTHKVVGDHATKNITFWFDQETTQQHTLAIGDGSHAEYATIVANRLPKKGEQNTVYLVSLENRLGSDGKFNYQNATNPDDKIRLVKLHGWAFTSTEHFKVSATHLDKASNLPVDIQNKLKTIKGAEFYTEAAFNKALTEQAKLTSGELTAHRDEIFKDFAFGDFAQTLKHLDRTTSTLRLPDVQNADVDPYLKTGFYPLPHRMRQGAQTVSWYHGPLAPVTNTETFDFPAKGADALLRYYEKDGMFDVSYAAAWELGRLLALQNTHFSTSLYQWKRRYAKAQNHGKNPGHLAGAKTDTTIEDLPAQIRDWLTKLEHLEGVPFNYLVPDEELLPVESIRFFQLDRLWMESLLDGAFSIGRVTSGDHALDVEIRTLENAFLPKEKPVSGFIMRSEAVAGWPGMQVEGKTTNDAPLKLIRRVALSPNVMLCLFEPKDDLEGYLQTLDLHLKPEVLHFGVNADGTKSLRNGNGEEIVQGIVVPFNEHQVIHIEDYRLESTKPDENEKGILSLIRNQKMKGIAWPDTQAEETSAALALQMLEGVEQVRFTK